MKNVRTGHYNFCLPLKVAMKTAYFDNADTMTCKLYLSWTIHQQWNILW